MKTEFDKGYEVGYKEAMEVSKMTTPTKEQIKPNTIAYIYWMIRNWGNSPK